VTDVRFLDFRDTGMMGTPENADPRSLHQADPERVVGSIVRAIRELRPAIIATWDASGGYGHPDHMAIHRHATQAYHAAADASRYPDAGAAWQTRALYYSVIPIQEFMKVAAELRERGITTGEAPGGDDNMAALPRVEPNCIVDVSSEYDRKQQALRAHRTQASEDGPFSKMPDDLLRRFFGREYFHRAHPPLADGAVLDDLLSALP